MLNKATIPYLNPLPLPFFSSWLTSLYEKGVQKRYRKNTRFTVTRLSCDSWPRTLTTSATEQASDKLHVEPQCPPLERRAVPIAYSPHGHEFGWTPGVGDGHGGLACCDSWGCKESDTTERLNWTELNWNSIINSCIFLPLCPLLSHFFFLLPLPIMSWDSACWTKWRMDSEYSKWNGGVHSCP